MDLRYRITLVSSMHRNREPLLHCAVFLELTAPDYDALKLLQTDVLTELVRSKLNVDRLMLRQQEGFVSVMPAGRNAFGAQFERVLPASSVANLYPFNYSGKTDPHGFYIGKDKYGANIRAALPGTVTVSQYNSSYGYYVIIDHGNGLSTLYGHNSRLLAQVGQTVEAGDIISLSGSTGRSTGPHLHFEVRVNGERTNPRYYLPKTGG